MKFIYLVAALLFPILVSAQLAVVVLPPKVIGEKAVVPLAMKNNFSESIKSAHAICFLLDEQGEMVGESTKWVIGGSATKSGVAAGATNSFNFVITSSQPFATTNLTAKVSFSQLVLESGESANIKQSVQIKE
jgi:hypothetical protein